MKTRELSKIWDVSDRVVRYKLRDLNRITLADIIKMQSEYTSLTYQEIMIAFMNEVKKREEKRNETITK